jgi:hypothetical protein
VIASVDLSVRSALTELTIWTLLALFTVAVVLLVLFVLDGRLAPRDYATSAWDLDDIEQWQAPEPMPAPVHDAPESVWQRFVAVMRQRQESLAGRPVIEASPVPAALAVVDPEPAEAGEDDAPDGAVPDVEEPPTGPLEDTWALLGREMPDWYRRGFTAEWAALGTPEDEVRAA